MYLNAQRNDNFYHESCYQLHVLQDVTLPQEEHMFMPQNTT